MADRDTQNDIGAAFAELRAGDAREAPGFDAVVRRPPSPTRWELPTLTIALATGLLLAAGLAFTLRSKHAGLEVPSAVIALAEWRPQTDALLEMRAPVSLLQAPRLGASLIDDIVQGELP